MKLAFIFGTRPELLKLIPVIKALERRCPGMVILFDTQQQRELTSGLLRDYAVNHIPHVRFDSYRSSLVGQLASQLTELDQLIVDCAGLVVQGDTISALSGALVGFYQSLPVVHIEAGLRSHDVSQPFPEEMNRRLISDITSLHLAPTQKEKDHLIACGIDGNDISVVGNPLADLCRKIKNNNEAPWDVLITMHRRENRASGIKELCNALDKLADQHPVYRFAVVQHSHPQVQRKFLRYLPVHPNLDYVSPMAHKVFLQALLTSKLVMTDSGGIQEEAAMFGVPTMILRDVLDRDDGIKAGTTQMVGVRNENIVNTANQMLKACTQSRRKLVFPEEHPSELIAEKILAYFSLRQESVA